MATEILKAASILSVGVAFFTPKKTRKSCNVSQLNTLRLGNIAPARNPLPAPAVDLLRDTKPAFLTP